MQRMAAGEFKAKCLGLIDEVNASGKTVIITKRGKPMARLLPFETLPKESPAAIFGCLRHFLASEKGLDDLVEPIFPLEDWDHLKDDWSLSRPK
ncbi:MAG: type II toxin-antitoxin system prevent-host-death family antitoxin [Terracidiphilus sp.]